MKDCSSINIIKNAIKTNKLSHAYLFYGSVGTNVEKPILNAIELILKNKNKEIKISKIEDLNNCYDIQVINTNNKEILKEQFDQKITKLFETSLEKDSIKILYIKNIDLGNKIFLNKLLKFIEEPVENLIILMNTNYLDKVLPTIKSRTQNIFIKKNIKSKIDLVKNIENKNASLIANIFVDDQQINKDNLEIVNDLIEKVVLILEKSLKNIFVIKEELFQLWNKNNSDFILKIIQLFFYQINIKIDDENPLFTNKDKLIIEFKKKNIEFIKIQKLIEKTRNNIKNYANFNLQKINFLNELENEIK
ncbi:MAG: hypothetical protein IKF44_01450 [Mycoplasmataceae bacterium]|nr:hypothetical protein [Mycoplasmataceae bacterium]